jgi:CubicO group peptidase (beta-lactamase class C family)
VFETRTIQRAVAEQTFFELDLTMGAPIRYSMGFILGARLASPYGVATQHAFGHLGFTNVFVYADPSRDIAVALLTSGKPVLTPALVRTLLIMQVIAARIPRDGTGPLLPRH